MQCLCFFTSQNLDHQYNPEHIDAIHRSNRDGQWNWWQQQGINFDIGNLMDYDPYLGRVSNPEPQEQ